MGRLFDFAAFGSPFERWFSPIAPHDARLHLRYRWSTRLLRWGSRYARVTIPRPEHTSLDNVSPILHWIEETLEAGETPHVWAYASAAVRMCQAAQREGANMHGLQFTATGEPLTEARLDAIRNAGADAVATYATVQSGPIGYGCLERNAREDFHFFDDLHALIQPGKSGAISMLPENAFLLSSLHMKAPVLFLNVALGDQGIVDSRECSCAVAQFGWNTHLRSVRSYEKLTAGGMTFFDADVIRVLEQVLPSKFGGAPTDYQLMEAEGDNGLPELRLIVDPGVGALDTRRIVESFIQSVGDRTQGGVVMSLAWRDAGMIRVERRRPFATTAGKILHLHCEPKHADAT